MGIKSSEKNFKVLIHTIFSKFLPLVIVCVGFWANPSRTLAVSSSDVASIIDIAIQEIEFIRLQKGREKPNPLIFKISNAAPRQIYHLALTFYHKSDRICFDHTGDVGPIPPGAKSGEINYDDIYRVMNGALKRIRCVRPSLNITDFPKTEPPLKPANPSEIYKNILISNRQINILLDNPYVPSTVYMRVQLAIEYGKSILRTQYPNVSLPTNPHFRKNKRPVDVYEQLLKCFDRVKEINRFLGEEIINYQVDDIGPYIVPGDVFDLASLLVSEVQSIRQQLIEEKQIKQLAPIAYPGRKAPSHVYQNGKYLEVILRTIETQLDQEQ